MKYNSNSKLKLNIQNFQISYWIVSSGLLEYKVQLLNMSGLLVYTSTFVEHVCKSFRRPTFALLLLISNSHNLFTKYLTLYMAFEQNHETCIRKKKNSPQKLERIKPSLLKYTPVIPKKNIISTQNRMTSRATR